MAERRGATRDGRLRASGNPCGDAACDRPSGAPPFSRRHVPPWICAMACPLPERNGLVERFAESPSWREARLRIDEAAMGASAMHVGRGGPVPLPSTDEGHLHMLEGGLCVLRDRRPSGQCTEASRRFAPPCRQAGFGHSCTQTGDRSGGRLRAAFRTVSA